MKDKNLNYRTSTTNFVKKHEFLCSIIIAEKSFPNSQKHESTLLHISVIHKKIDSLEILYISYVGLDN